MQQLTSQTGGGITGGDDIDLASQFQRIQKDISGQYVLRWATLKRAAVPAFRWRASSRPSKSPATGSPQLEYQHCHNQRHAD